MATKTSYLKLTKPDYSDYADISVINTNMDLIDDAYNSLYNKYLPLTGGTLTGRLGFLNTNVSDVPYLLRVHDNTNFDIGIHEDSTDDYRAVNKISLCSKERPIWYNAVNGIKDIAILDDITNTVKNYLPLTGGTLTGVVTHNADIALTGNKVLRRDTNDASLELRGGIDWSNGASLSLSGKTRNGDYCGACIIDTTNGSNTANYRFLPTGKIYGNQTTTITASDKASVVLNNGGSIDLKSNNNILTFSSNVLSSNNLRIKNTIDTGDIAFTGGSTNGGQLILQGQSNNGNAIITATNGTNSNSLTISPTRTTTSNAMSVGSTLTITNSKQSSINSFIRLNDHGDFEVVSNGSVVTSSPNQPKWYSTANGTKTMAMVEDVASTYLPLAGGTVTGNLTVNGTAKMNGVTVSSSTTDALKLANEGYYFAVNKSNNKAYVGMGNTLKTIMMYEGSSSHYIKFDDGTMLWFDYFNVTGNDPVARSVTFTTPFKTLQSVILTVNQNTGQNTVGMVAWTTATSNTGFDMRVGYRQTLYTGTTVDARVSCFAIGQWK